MPVLHSLPLLGIYFNYKTENYTQNWQFWSCPEKKRTHKTQQTNLCLRSAAGGFPRPSAESRGDSWGYEGAARGCRGRPAAPGSRTSPASARRRGRAVAAPAASSAGRELLSSGEANPPSGAWLKRGLRSGGESVTGKVGFKPGSVGLCVTSSTVWRFSWFLPQF